MAGGLSAERTKSGDRESNCENSGSISHGRNGYERRPDRATPLADLNKSLTMLPAIFDEPPLAVQPQYLQSKE